MPDYSIPIYPRSAGFDHTPVDAFGAFSLAMDTSGWPQLIAGHSTYRGDCDPEAFAHCIETVAASRPVFNSYLAGIGPRQNQELVWRHQSRPFKAEIRDLSSLPGPAPGQDFDDWLSEHSGLASWEPDLTVEFPIRYVISRLPDDRWALSNSIHHAVGDLGMLSTFGMDIERCYDTAVHGSAAQLDVQYTSFAERQEITLPPTVSLREFARIVREEEREYPRKAVAQPIGTRGAPKRIAVHGLFEPEMVGALRSRARAAGGSLTDLTVAGVTLAVAEWNANHGVPAVVQRHNVAVGQRGRSSAEWDLTAGTQTSLVAVCTRQGEWDDPDKLLALVARKRVERMEQGYDIIFGRVTKRVMRMLSAVPINRRLALIRNRVRPDQTMLLSNVGTLGHDQDDPNAEYRIGNMVLESHFSMGLCMPDYPTTMSLSRLGDSTQMKIGSNEGHMTKSELKQFHALVVAKIEAYAD